MIYSLLKRYARLAIKVYCPRLVVNRPEVFHAQGPLLLAANHPNSFLDGIILTTLFDGPVYSLARGDAFKPAWAGRLLRRMRLLPVYRTSEGVENLEHNYTTFSACREAFARGGIVLIFSEGRCENEWHLRPLRKGTARLALSSWSAGLSVPVLPTAINYDSFGTAIKEAHLSFGTPIDAQIIDGIEGEGRRLLAFNAELQRQLEQMVYEIPPNDKSIHQHYFPKHQRAPLYYLSLPFIALTRLLHAPLYLLCRLLARRFRGSGHHDSVLIALLLLTWPPYFLLLLALSFYFFGWWASLLLLIPLLATAKTTLGK